MSIYTDNGFENRKNYLNYLSAEYGVELSIVMSLAEILGETEDFDALPIEVEEYSDMYGEDN
jgi:hypothetical protein